MKLRGIFLSSSLILLAGCAIEAEGTFDTDIGSSGGNTQEGGAGGAGGKVSLGGNGGFGGTQEGKPCSFPGACDDGNPCTVDTCVDKKCKYTPAPSETNCSDGDKCKVSFCNGAGTCKQKGLIEGIDDDNVCTIDLCDPATGTINHKGNEECECDTDADCSDNNECTIDACKDDGSGKRTCSYTSQSVGTSCDDKNPCTTGDQCDNGGKCQGALINVDDGNPCTIDSCDSATGAPAHQVSLGQACNDTDACTVDDQCNDTGKCEGAPVAVDDGDKCTVDICDQITGNIDHKGIAGCKSCSTDNDCNDGNSCTTDICKNTVCIYADVPQGGACDDGNLCTIKDQCDVSGKCTGTPKSVDDGNPCTTDLCDSATGNPVNKPALGQSCSDGNACTVNDNCNGSGACIGTKKSVDDANECTTDSCDPVTGNDSHTPLPNCKSCKNNNDCNDNNPCTVDSCNSGKCSYTNASKGTACSDGNNCTESDKCDGSSVCKGMLKNVDDGDPCTTDSCDSATGNAVHTPSSGASCSDGNACTLGDQCNQGKCVGTPKSVDDANECTTDSCDPATGNVGHVPLLNCKPCSSNGDCNDNNVCTVDSCSSGKCSYTNASNSTSCDDGNQCTTNDKCDGNGSCKGTVKTCNTPLPGCYQSTGSCNPGDGECVYPLASNGTSCSDGNACTLVDTCQGGTCTPGAPKTCTPPNTQCYELGGSCSPDTGSCSFTPKSSGTSCDDGNKCTENDACNGGGSCEGTPKSVDDGNECTTDSCDPATGNVSHVSQPNCKPCNSISDCNDNKPCTVDSCTSGKCSYTNASSGTSCDDGNKCTTNDNCDGSGTCSGSDSGTCNGGGGNGGGGNGGGGAGGENGSAGGGG